MPLIRMLRYSTLALVVSCSLSVAAAQPKLVLQITVDQLRSDLPVRVLASLPKGGLRYLYEQGHVFSRASHRHGNTETIVGHASIATGSDPSVHGMIGNVWYDKQLGRNVYNIEDADYYLLGDNAGVDQDSEVDSSQKVAKTDGRSPAAIIGSTLADEIYLASAGKSKVFAVSVKDRGAVSMAGHSGKEFWFSKASGQFITSNYYYDAYPSWVTQWNSSDKLSRFSQDAWVLSNDRQQYRMADQDDRPYETDLAGFGRTFPHAYPSADSKYFTTLLTTSPAGDELTLDFAQTLLKSEQLGQDSVTDYLSVSFSSTDYIGHLFGPASLESEDNLYRLDKSIAALLKTIDKQVGLEHTLIVFSADHGAAEAPGYLSEHKTPSGYIAADFFKAPAVDEALKARLGVGVEVISQYTHPYIYLNHALLAKKNLSATEVEAALQAIISKQPGIHSLVSTKAALSNGLPNTRLANSVLFNSHAERSGDLFVIFKPHWFVNDFDGLSVATTHGSPWVYDQRVPMIFVGNKIKAAESAAEVYTIDIAPTVTNYLGIKPPSGATGVARELKH